MADTRYNTTIAEIRNLIGSNIFIDDILKYIIPHFHMDTTNKNNKLLAFSNNGQVDYFIDK